MNPKFVTGTRGNCGANFGFAALGDRGASLFGGVVAFANAVYAAGYDVTVPGVAPPEPPLPDRELPPLVLIMGIDW